jgi:hypothetical protein
MIVEKRRNRMGCHLLFSPRIRFWALSYSMGEPCGRSNQLITYFMFFPSFANGLTDHCALLYSPGDRRWAPEESGMFSDLISVLGQESD